MPRAHNEGSVYQRKDGRYVAQVRVGDKVIYRYAKSEAEALEKLKQLHASELTGTLALPSNLRLSDWVEQWLTLQAPSLRPSSILTYRQCLAKVTAIAGKQRLDKLTPLMLTQVFAQLQRSDGSPRRVYLAHGYLRGCLQRAVELGLIATNPMDKVKKPKWEAQKREYWNVEQVNAFLAAASQHESRWDALFAFLVLSGLRLSEGLALTWGDVDWEQKRVRVDKAMVWVENECHILPPKTKAGSRWVSLPDPAMQALHSLPRSLNNTAPVFRTSSGTPPTRTNLRRSLQRLCERAGVPRLNVHGLRHVAATLAIKATHDAHAVQRRLGHSHVSITMGIYAYALEEESQVAGAVDRLLSSGSA